MIDRVQIAQRLFNSPLMILPEKASVVAEVLMGGDAASVNLDRLTPSARQTVQGPARGALPFEVSNGVAYIPIIGSLVNRGAWIGASSGITSYDGLKRQFSVAASDDRVKSVVLDIDSPGGEAVGCFECSDVLRTLASRKPVTAFINGLAASAAYAIASAASKIVTIPTGVLGSIGVVMLHRDYSGALAKAGVKPTLIFAGAHKVDGHSFSALPESVQADLQGEIDGYYDMFVACVATNRRVPAAAVRATEARTYIGKAAIDVGLADELGSIESFLKSSNVPSSPALTLTQHSSHQTGLGIDTSALLEAEKNRIGAILTSAGGMRYPLVANILAADPKMSVETALEVFRVADANTPKAPVQRADDGTDNSFGITIITDIQKFMASHGMANYPGSSSALPDAADVYEARKR